MAKNMTEAEIDEVKSIAGYINEFDPRFKGLNSNDGEALRKLIDGANKEIKKLLEGVAEPRYIKEGYKSGPRSNNLFLKDNAKKIINVTDWSRSFNKADIANEIRLFLGEDYVKIAPGKWRSLDGTRQFRVKSDDYLGIHGIGMPEVPNTPHVHLEFLQPNASGSKFKVIKNIHVPLK